MTSSGERYEGGAIPLDHIGETQDFMVGKLGIHLAWETLGDGPLIPERAQLLAHLPTLDPDLELHTTWSRPVHDDKSTLALSTTITAASDNVKFPDKDAFVDGLSELARDNDLSLRGSMFTNMRYTTDAKSGRHLAQVSYYDKSVTITNDSPVQYLRSSPKFGPGQLFRPTPIDRIDGHWGDQRHYVAMHLATGVMSLVVLNALISERAVAPAEFIFSPSGTFYYDEELQLCIPVTSPYDLIKYPRTPDVNESGPESREIVDLSSSVTPEEDYEEITELSDFAGLEHITAQLRDVARSFKHPEIMKKYRAKRPNGILFYGQAGTGKSMLARALAHEIGGALWEIKVSELIDQMLGGSQKNMQKVFDTAAKISTPTVMLWDEIDAMLGKNEGSSSAGREVNSMIGVFKTEMATLIDKNPNIIVAATTNKPELLDDAVIRAGRFDLKLDIPLPVEAARLRIWTNKITDDIASTGTHLNPDRFHPDTSDSYDKEFTLYADDIDIPVLAKMSDEMSGSDIVECLRRARFECAMHEVRTGEPRQITQQLLLDTIHSYHRS